MRMLLLALGLCVLAESARRCLPHVRRARVSPLKRRSRVADTRPAVIGVPDERMGEVGMAFLVAAPGKEVSADIVRDWSRENMANYKVPRYIEIVDELPVNASGKVTKFILREQAEKILSTQE